MKYKDLDTFVIYSVVVQCIANLSLPATCRVQLLETLLTALDFDFRYEAFSMLHSQLPTLVMDIK